MLMRRRPLNPNLHRNLNLGLVRCHGVNRNRLRLRSGLRLRGATLALLLVLPPFVIRHSSFAASITLTPSADTALHEYFPGHNLGAQAWMTAGTTQNGPRTRGLMMFDLTGVIPPGSVINSVSLTVDVTGQPVDGDAPSNFGLHRMLVGWNEGAGSGAPPSLGRPALPGETTWNERVAGLAAWGAPGGLAGVDFAAQFSSDTFIYGVNFSPYVFDTTARLVADVQLWLDQPAQNFGWMLMTQAESEIFSARRFASREDPFRAPSLVIDFTPVPEPAAWMLLALAGGALWLRRKFASPPRDRSRFGEAKARPARWRAG